jgi:PAS domain-containing protein
VAKIDFGCVVDALSALVWTTQDDGRGDFVNRAWREYMALTIDEAAGHGWQTAIHPEDRTSFTHAWDRGVIGPNLRCRRLAGWYCDGYVTPPAEVLILSTGIF